MNIFVFGSNLLGIHGKGAALTARKEYGAVLGCGLGRTGRAYAIATKKKPTMNAADVIALPAIKLQVQMFLVYAANNLNDKFIIARVGCGLAGYTDAQIAPMFKGAPINCEFPTEWLPFLD